MGFPNRLRYLRVRSRLSQDELGKLIDRSKNTVRSHERGDTQMDTRDLADYAKVFKCFASELFARPKMPKKFKG